MLLLIEKGVLSADEVVQAVEDLAEHHRVAWEEAETSRGRAMHKGINAAVERFLVNRSFYGATPAKRRKAPRPPRKS